MRRPIVVRLAIFLATTVAAWGILSLGGGPESQLEVGDVATRDYEAEVPADVLDTVETKRLKADASASVEPILTVSTDNQNQVNDNINDLFDMIKQAVVAPVPETTATTLPSTTTTTEPQPGTTVEAAVEPDPAVLSGVVYLDVDGLPGYQPSKEGESADVGIPKISVTVSSDGTQTSVESDADGIWTAEVPAGDGIVVTVDTSDGDIPEGFVLGPSDAQLELDCAAGETCSPDPVGFVANVRSVDEVVTELSGSQDLSISTETLTALVTAAAGDVVRSALGGESHLEAIRKASLDRVSQEFGRGDLTEDEIPQARARIANSPPVVLLDDVSDAEAGAAAADVAAGYLLPNYVVDQVATEQARAAQAEAVPDQIKPYEAGEIIASKGDRLSQLQIDAITATSSLATQAEAKGGLLAVIVVLVGMLGLYLSRFRQEFWARPRMVALLGILVVLTAASVRGTVAVESQADTWYVLPAVAFGFMAAVLFDSRIAVLMALTVGVLTAVGTNDTGIAVYATLATLAPIPFVSSVSSRGAFRNAVVLSAMTAAVVAAGTSWFFHVGPNDNTFEVVSISVAWAFGMSGVAGMVGLVALQFFESAFDITTTLRLLDLTDRNHEALQLLQEEAFGSFNHSLMVGTLAHAAARAIGANALLARAMAYYHDLGKTANPMYFIENQFGTTNPHDELTPEESAEVIRRHVTDGIELAEKYKIPSEVATAIVSHHGDGIMRYFYERARSERGEDVDPDLFRHVGHKPRTAESAIVMLADSLEAACRAVFQTEEPTPQAIEKVVDRVMDEKLNDGQLRESPLTLGELTQIRSAFLESLIGHYHQRIAYPNFPGS